MMEMEEGPLDLRIVLIEPIYMPNVGYVARSMKNFGLEELFIVNPKGNVESAKPYAAHAQEILEKAGIVEKLDDALDGVDLVVGTTAKPAKSPRKISRICVTPREFAAHCDQHGGRLALLLGREDTGLRNREIERCDMLITIPANPTYPTLNISHVAAIIFYELHLKKTTPLKIILDPKLKERLMEEFHRLVDVSAIPVHRRKITENAFKNLINRSWMTRREATLIIGAFRRCLNVLAK